MPDFPRIPPTPYFASLFGGLVRRKHGAKALGSRLTAHACALKQAQHEELERYRHVFDHMSDGFGVLDANWCVLQMNAAGLLYGQRTAEQVIGRNHWEVWPETVGTELQGMYERVMRTGLPESLRQPIPLSHGQDPVFDITAQRTPNGFLAVFFRDLTALVASQDLHDVEIRKDEFLGLLAHELRNPLAPIVTAAEILRRGDLDREAVGKVGELIQRQARHMTALLADLLDVSRIDKGLVTLTRTVVDLHKVLADAIEQTRPSMTVRSQRFNLRAPTGHLPIDGDDSRLVQIFANILNNASKYTPARGEITLLVAAEGGSVVVKVRDSGIGMSAQLLPHVFEIFTQAERSSDRTLGGLGLGLALVKNLVELHGGQVTAHSAGLGQGSELTVTFPLAGPAPGPDRRSGGTRQASAHPVHIVVVDDNVDAGFTLATLLEMEGHSVSVRHAAEDALRGTEDGFADVYVLDIGLPGMDGYKLAREIRASAPSPGPLLIALTGYGSAQDREKSTAAGFDHHFEKPLDPSRLLDLIGKTPRMTARAWPALPAVLE
jgi:PAS domain S-box-containing protein